MTTQERKARLLVELTLLQKTLWKHTDIRAYYGCASAKANEIRKKALEAGGKIDYNPHAVQSRYVLMLEGTTPEIEIRKRSIEYNDGADPEIESDQ